MKTLDIAKTVYKVSDFLSWQKAGSLVLSPSFQRRPVWEAGAKSFLIDTVVRGLPMPIIFLREQKFRTIMDTIDNMLGNEVKYTPFSKKTLFYTLFAFIYDCHFGLKSRLEKATPKSISSASILYSKYHRS